MDPITFKPGDAELDLSPSGRTLKFYLYTAAGKELRHTWDCHEVGVNDGNPPDGDEFGHHCRIPRGSGYVVGEPMYLDPPEEAFGKWFIPVGDDPDRDFEQHGREGIGLHGGGTGLADPFAPRQGWIDTYGCPRLQNADLAQLVDSVQYVHRNGGRVFLNVID